MPDAFVGRAFIQVSPSFTGFQAAIRKELTSQLSSAGIVAGKSFSDSVGKATGNGSKVIPTQGMGNEGDKAGKTVAQRINAGLATINEKTISAVSNVLGTMGRQAANVGGAMTIAFGGFAVEAAKTAMRAGEMDAALGAIAKQTGVSKKAMDDQVKTVRSTGITMGVAQGLVAQFARSNLDMAKATDVARVAQDLAILTQQDSSETLDELLYAIQTGNTNLNAFRQLNINATDAQEKFAASIGKSRKDLTQAEKQQALLNAVIEAGVPIAGTYTAAMEEPGKVLRSFPRLFDDIKLAFGQAFLPAIADVIGHGGDKPTGLYGLVSAISKGVEEGGKFRPVVDALGGVIKSILAPISQIANAMLRWVQNLPTKSVEGFAGAIKNMAPILPGIGSALAIFAGKNFLGQIPVVGDQLATMVGKLGPVKGGLIGLALGFPPVQKAIAEVAKAFAPLLEMLGAKATDILGKLTPVFTRVFEKVLPPLTKVAEIIAETLMDALEGLMPAIDALTDAFGPLLEALGELVGWLLDKLKPVIKPLTYALIGFVIANWAWNTALWANVAAMLAQAAAMIAAYWPIYLIVAAVVAVIAAIWLLVKNWETVWNFIKDIAKWTWENALKPTWEAMKVAWRAIADAFKWAYDNLIRPTWDAMKTAADFVFNRLIMPVVRAFQAAWTATANAIKWAWDTIINPVLQVMWRIFQIVLAVYIGIQVIIFQNLWKAMSLLIQFMWNSVIRPVLNAFASVFTWLFNNILKPIMSAITAAWNAVAAAFKWAYDNIVRPAINALVSAFQWMWNNILLPIINAFRAAWDATARALRWVYDNIIKPMLNALQAAWQWLWNNILRPGFDAMRAVWRAMSDAMKWAFDFIVKPMWDALGRALTGVRNAFQTATDFIKRVWDAMARGLKAAYDNTIGWVFSKIPEALGAVRRAFDEAVSFIGRVWDKLKGLVRTPVAWVVNSVINPLIRGANSILDKIGLGIKPIAGFAQGGQVPGGWGGGDRVPALLEPGEWVLTKTQARAIGYGRLRNLPRYQEGGEVGADRERPSTRFGLGDIFGKIKSAGGFLLGGVDDLINAATGMIRWVAFQAFEALTLPLRKLLEGAASAPIPPELFRQAMGKWGINVLDAMLQFVRGKTEDEDWAGGMGVDELAKTIIAQFPGLRVTSGLRPNDTKSLHSKNLARDLADGRDLMGRAAAWIDQNLAGSLLEGIYKGPPNLSVKNGKRVPPSFWGAATWGIHDNHIHIASEAAAAMGGNVGEWIARAIQATGVNPTVWSTALRYQIQRESGGNPRAQNNTDVNARAGTPSKGIMQVIDPTFRAYMLPGMGDIWNPVHNIVAAIRYIMGSPRYRATANSLGRWVPGGGYDSGGFLPVGASIAINNTGRPEPVLTPRQWEAVQRNGVEPRRETPAVVVNNATFQEPVDITLFLRKVAWAEQIGAI